MSNNFQNSQLLFEEASKHLVGGVNSPVRAFKSVGGTPLFITRAKGPHLWDADGNEYVDYIGSWGPAILGHAHPEVLRAIHETMKEGLSFGAPCPKEILLAQEVKAAFPSIDLLRFVSSGTEAVMGAIRVARGFTKRKMIVKFDGCYHGHADYLLVKAGSGAATLGVPDSAGVPEEFAKLTLTARYNDLDSVAELFKANPDQIACVIVEPIVGNMGCIQPAAGFLKGLQELTRKEGALLIFDEVMTGFRVSYGGAQELFGMTPELTCLGKIIGGGLPVGAYGGRRDVMECVAPLGPVYQAGTLSGNPVAMAAGIATLKNLKPTAKNNVYEKLEVMGEKLESGLKEIGKSQIQINRVGSMMTLFFTNEKVTDADSARLADTKKFATFFQHMLNHGIYWAPSQFEAIFFGISHTELELNKTLDAFKAFTVD